MLPTTVRSSSRVQPPSSHPMALAVQDVEEQFLLLSNSWPRAQCGTKNASTAMNVISLKMLRNSMADLCVFSGHRPLDSMLACDGPDKEIHCRSCYGRLFGPKGFGYGHTPTLSTNGESTLNR